MVRSPLISVVMPVYNSEDYIRTAIESILTQTFTDFEFLIYNDGSTDKSHDIITSFNDERIVYKRIENNEGYLNLLNDGLLAAKGKYIARMDADDISLPNRFEEQFKYLENHTDVGICGSWVQFFGALNYIQKSPVTFKEIQFRLFFGCPLTHPSVMMRSEFIKKYELKYRPEYYYAEDHYFFAQAALRFKIVNLPEVLLKYRIHNSQVGSVKWKEQFILKSKIQARLFYNLLEDGKDIDLRWLTMFFIEDSIPDKEWIKKIEFYKAKIINANRKLNVYPGDILEKAVTGLFDLKKEKNFYKFFFQKYYNQKRFNPIKLYQFLKEKYQPQRHFGKKLTLLFILKCLVFYRKKTVVQI